MRLDHFALEYLTVYVLSIFTVHLYFSDPYVRVTLYRGDREDGAIDIRHTAVIKKVKKQFDTYI